MSIFDLVQDGYTVLLTNFGTRSNKFYLIFMSCGRLMSALIIFFMHQTIYSIVFLLLSFNLFAQQELGLHLMQNTWQTATTNPAIVPDQKIVIGLPSIYANHYLTGVNYEDLLGEKDSGNKTLMIGNAIANMKADNFLREQASIETISIGYRLGSIFFSLNHAVKYQAFLNFPKTLPQLIWQGNSQFVGQTIDLSNDLHVTGYNEIGLGIAAQVSNLISVGAKIKLLTGIGDVSTDQTDLSLLTSDDIYQLTLDGNYKINSSSYFNYGGINDFNFQFDFGKINAENIFTSNTGIGLDLGIQVKLEKLNIAFSAIDIGQIKWTENVNNYEFEGPTEYTGLDVVQAFTEGNISLDSALDTLEQVFTIQNTKNSYTTKLPTRLYLSTNYQLNSRWRIGAVVQTEFYRNQIFPAFAVGGNYTLNKFLSLGATYAVINEVYDNFGLNAVLKAGPIQIFATADNVISAFNVVDNNANARVGVNLLFK